MRAGSRWSTCSGWPVWRSAGAGRTAAATVALLFLVVAARPALAAPELHLSPASGPPGSTFTVTGTGFAAAEVEIRWASEDGPLLATAVGPDFMVEATVPDDASTDSHPVVTVVREGSSVSNVPFQVTSGEPTEPVEPTTTTVPAPADTSPATTPTTAPTASDPGSGGGLGVSRAPSLGGGVDGGMADTTNGGGGEGGNDRALGAPTAAGAAGTTPTGEATTTTTAAGTAGAPEGATPSLPARTGAEGAPSVGAGDPAAAPGPDGAPGRGSEVAGRSTSQSAGAVRNPALLAVGLGLVFAAGVVLAGRNRQRARAPG